MPTYDYVCDSCGHSFETFQRMSDPTLQVCPACHAPSLRRVISGGTGVIFKGSGFYVNDSRSAKSASGSGESKTETKTDSSSEAKVPESATASTPKESSKKSEPAVSSGKKGEKKSA